MTHRNAPLSLEGRRRLVERCQTRPIAHVAAEMGISRACASKWVNRWRQHGELGLMDRSSAPHRTPNATPAEVIGKIEAWRHEHKWSAQRITDELSDAGISIHRRTVTRHLHRLDLGRRRYIDPVGETNRKPVKITARCPGYMVHLDMEKVGRIPDGGGWRVHGRDSEQKRAVDRAKTTGAKRGYVYVHSAVDGFSRLAYTEPLPDEKGVIAAAFTARAKCGSPLTGSPTSTAWSPTTEPATDPATSVALSARRPVTKKTRPYTPRHSGKVERYQRILAEELLNARTYDGEDERSDAIAVWNIHYNYHRPHSAAGGRPPASRLKAGVTNVRPSYN